MPSATRYTFPALCARILAHLALCASAIPFRAAADMWRGPPRRPGALRPSSLGASIRPHSRQALVGARPRPL
jgi:hypothetical protein